jgi:hypothetical protein
MASGAFLSKVASEHPMANHNAFSKSLSLHNNTLQHNYAPLQLAEPCIRNYYENQPVFRNNSVNQQQLHLLVPQLLASSGQPLVTPQPVVTETIITTASI